MGLDQLSLFVPPPRAGSSVAEAAVVPFTPLAQARRQSPSDLSQLGETELLGLLLDGASPGERRRAEIGAALEELGGLMQLRAASLDRLAGLALSPEAFDQLRGAVELACRLGFARIPERQTLDRPTEVARYLFLRYHSIHQEVFGILFLDSQLGLLGVEEIFRGTRKRCSANPGPILRRALLRGTAQIAVFHTHPGASTTPSEEDECFTKLLLHAAEVLDIRVVDHLIVDAVGEVYSLLRRERFRLQV